MPENRAAHDGVRDGVRDAVCIDAGRVYDSCAEKDCMENLLVRFTQHDQMIIDHAVSVRGKRCEVITVFIDVEPLPFHSGFFSCDLTFFFEVECEVFVGRGAPCHMVTGVCAAQKKVILFGSEGGVKIFTSEGVGGICEGKDEVESRNVPRCNVQVAEPVILSCTLVNMCDCPHGGEDTVIPDAIASRFDGEFCHERSEKAVLCTIGVFTIVQLIRNVQMLVPVFDFCMPTKECGPHTDNPCELFRKMQFPTDEFFPPKDEREGCRRESR